MNIRLNTPLQSLLKNPNYSFAREVTRHRLGCPSGLLVFHRIYPLNPVISVIRFTNSPMLISRPTPRFTGSSLLYLAVARITARLASATYRYSREELPVSQTRQLVSLSTPLLRTFYEGRN